MLKVVYVNAAGKLWVYLAFFGITLKSFRCLYKWSYVLPCLLLNQLMIVILCWILGPKSGCCQRTGKRLPGQLKCVEVRIIIFYDYMRNGYGFKVFVIVRFWILLLKSCQLQHLIKEQEKVLITKLLILEVIVYTTEVFKLLQPDIFLTVIMTDIHLLCNIIII